MATNTSLQKQENVLLYCKMESAIQSAIDRESVVPWIKGNPSKFPDRQNLVTVTLIQRQDSN
jgi:hypothetical protein